MKTISFSAHKSMFHSINDKQAPGHKSTFLTIYVKQASTFLTIYVKQVSTLKNNGALSEW